MVEKVKMKSTNELTDVPKFIKFMDLLGRSHRNIADVFNSKVKFSLLEFEQAKAKQQLGLIQMAEINFLPKICTADTCQQLKR